MGIDQSVKADAPAILLESSENTRQDELEIRARHLAESAQDSGKSHKTPWVIERLQDQEALLKEAHQYCLGASEKEFTPSYAAEWLLDNYYVVQQALRQVREDLPKGYYRKLPRLAGGRLRGEPRILEIAMAILDECRGDLQPEPVARFIEAYQSVRSLTTGEIWALPIMLRVGVLEYLAQSFASIASLVMPGGMSPVILPEGVPCEDVVARGILSLRMLAAYDWKVFFEQVSQVEQILKRDPVDCYSRMVFDTRDRYRKVVEQIAQKSGFSEVEVALQAIRLAQERHSDHESCREAHVGYFLIDAGRTWLEKSLPYIPPRKTRLTRLLLAHPTRVYLTPIAVMTLLILLAPVIVALREGGSLLQILSVTLLGLVPGVTIAVSVVNWLVTLLLPPRVLPKLDFSEGLPEDCKTVVVVPSMLTHREEVESLLRQMELHFLSNRDPRLFFALLTDFKDATQKHLEGDELLVETASRGIEVLNRQYPREGGNPFFLFHRERLWNSGEGVWMGWERKRGKLDEFNALLLGKGETSYTIKLGDLEALKGTRYVITLDADTVLPRDSAHRLVGALAHPLNRARFDEKTCRVAAGYTVLQPRTEIKPTSACRSPFTEIFSGDAGLDLYTLAVSDVYQDLFGEGLYVGKGIYDVEAFEKCLAGRIPENSLLSHDLMESLHVRAGLVTDVVLLEEYPPTYIAYAQRMHRWIRGDWQLLPWLCRRMPCAGTTPIRLSFIAHWKILDNLRRSLLAPSLLILIAAACFAPFDSALLWIILALLTPAISLFTGMAGHVLNRMRDDRPVTSVYLSRTQLMRWLLTMVLLAYEGLLSLNAILTTLARLVFTRRNLLQWTTAAQAASLCSTNGEYSRTLRKMCGAPLFALALGLPAALNDFATFLVAAPLLVAWLLSPLIAYRISLPIRRRREPVTTGQRDRLRRLARRTWFYFERFVGPDDHWLPPDHFQESPRGLTAHRTSPTNIGLMLLSTLAAFDFGYIDIVSMAMTLRNTFRSMDMLQRYRGHFLNWYDTRTMEPLPPRYVSTVDSGNLSGCLLALKEGCAALADTPVLRWQRWEGLLDTLQVLEEVIYEVEHPGPGTAEALKAHLDLIREQVLAVREKPENWAPLLSTLAEEDGPKLDRLLGVLLKAGAPTMDAESFNSLRTWSERVRHHIFAAQRELNALLPWLFPLEHPPEIFLKDDTDHTLIQAWQNLMELLPANPTLRELAQSCSEALNALAILQKRLADVKDTQPLAKSANDWCEYLAQVLKAALDNTKGLLKDYRELADLAEGYVQAASFGFLLNTRRKLFHIGYHVDAGTLDGNFYDLLASESRIASLVAVAKGDVPQSHWLHLGRPLTRMDGTRGLLSWSGSMFEYLMPCLLVRDYENTLIGQSDRAAVERQIHYGSVKKVPWGISESCYHRFDANQVYQYRAFGVPGLGLKRGLEEDLVVAPYASILALSINPRAVLHNLDRLTEMGILGNCGFYEALDFTPSRGASEQDWDLIRSYMAHHQGMVMISLVNFLKDEVMIRRFHADPRVQSIEMLLQEQFPWRAPLEQFSLEEGASCHVIPTQPAITAEPWRVSLMAPFPQVHLLSNGSFSTLITSAGGGFCQWKETALTRWRADACLDDWGMWIYVKDQQNGHLWSAGYQPTATAAETREVFFSPHKADFQCSENGIALHMEVTVPPEDPLEIRRLTLTNRGDESKRLMVTSYGEVTLAPQEKDRRHPAFNKLFIESEYLPEMNSLIFHRRLQSPEETPICLLHALVLPRGITPGGFHEGDRARFPGRGGSLRSPRALSEEGAGLPGATGATLDPIMALGQELELRAGETVKIAFITIAAPSRSQALDLLERYRDWAPIDWAFNQARSQSEQELRRLDLTVAELERIQQLLSLLIYPHATLRADPEVLASNTGGQTRLWPYAISGDYPILLARVRGEEEVALVKELLRAHTYWRSRGLKIDLVIVNSHDTGYDQELQRQLLALLKHTDSDLWLNQRGGIFLLRADQMAEPDRISLTAAGRVILDGEKGSMAKQLEGIVKAPTYLPHFVPAMPGAADRSPTPPLARPSGLLFDNGLGGFTPDGLEYIIYLEEGQVTPAPWINVIATPEFGFLVSEAGSGFSWARNSSENRLTSFHNDPVQDFSGESLYLRDEETARVWSPTPRPSPGPGAYLVRHGAGYTVFQHHSGGLRQLLTVFATPGDPVKIARLRLENTWNHTRRITATYFAEWVLGTDRDTMQQFVVPEYDEDTGALLARNPYNADSGERVAFLGASTQAHGLTADRTEFLGRMESRSAPAALSRIGLSGSVRAGLDPCAALQLHLDLLPGAAEEVYFILGQGADRQEAVELVKRYRDPAAVDAAMGEVKASWDRLLGAVTLDTPEPAMNLMLNRWLLYQALSCRIWARSALYQSSGAYGFRDQLQDVMALLDRAPEIAREQILSAARHQFEEGDVLHWWHPPSGRGVRTRMSDDLLWLPFVTAHYLEVTGDSSLLSERVPFLRGAPLEPGEVERYDHYAETPQSGTIYEHCRRAVEKGLTHGPHALPLIGTGDWNDGLNRVGVGGKGESIWLGWFLCAVLTAFSPLCRAQGETEQADSFDREAENLRRALNTHGWDGEWYLRALCDDGTPLGSSSGAECSIEAMAQSWAVLSGAAEAGRASRAMEAAAARLVREKEGLVLLFTPPFERTVLDPGYIKAYPPGIRENGGQYTHAAVWTGWAFAALGQGDRAEQVFRLINPINHSDTPEKARLYRVEPYVAAGDIYGAPPHVGRGGWTWYTGAAGWMYRLGVEVILGVRRRGAFLEIDPCIPGTWKGFEVHYRYGASMYRVRVENPGGVNRGVKRIVCDGKELPGRRIPLVDDGSPHRVDVLLGIKEGI